MAEERGGAEARRHFRGARFIMEAGLRLGLGSAALSTALGAFLRFAREHRSPYDPALVAAAALLLAGKAQGAGPRARDVINVTHRRWPCRLCCSQWSSAAVGRRRGHRPAGGRC
ncbi:cyclin-Q isoform X2 [Gallus gallus]|uniref:cyclin-Q isoform X2 n=1 Tax=Gallus gallus TaxID=9031 RepID=UPI001AEA2FBC|nr:cyclin-Q isoform X2 [Gallus gallus]